MRTVEEIPPMYLPREKWSKIVDMANWSDDEAIPSLRGRLDTIQEIVFGLIPGRNACGCVDVRGAEKCKN